MYPDFPIQTVTQVATVLMGESPLQMDSGQQMRKE